MYSLYEYNKAGHMKVIKEEAFEEGFNEGYSKECTRIITAM